MGIAVYKGPFGREQAERLLWRAGFGPRRGRGRGAGEARAPRRRPLADPARRREVRRPRAPRRQGPRARARRRLGPRPPLVARPDGADVAPARRADDARLARLVRDLARRRRLAEADAEAEQAAAPPLARLVRLDAPRDHEGPGDAAVALRHGEHEVVAERELRPRADGALHARRRPRLHRARRARAGPRPDRLRQRLEARPRQRQLPLRGQAPRPGTEARLRQDGRVRLAGRRPALPPPPEASVLLRRQALALLRPDDARRGDAARRSRASTARTSRSGPSSRRSSSTPPLHTGPRMVKPPAVYTAGLLRALGRGVDTQAWAWLSSHVRPAALHAAERRPAGTTSAGSTPRPSAAAGRSRTTPAARSR